MSCCPQLIVITTTFLALLFGVLLLIDHAFHDAVANGGPHNLALNQIIEMLVPSNAGVHHSTADLEWARSLRDNAGVFKQEWDAFESFIGGEQGLKDFTHNNGLSYPDWKNVFLFNIGSVNEMVAGHFPKTLAVLFATPLVSAAFSVLPRGKTIRPHNGEYKGVLRYHLTLWSTNLTVQWEHDWNPFLELAHLVQPAWVTFPAKGAPPGTTLKKMPPQEPIPAAHLGIFIPRDDAHTAVVDHMAGVMTLGYLAGQDLLFDDTFFHYAVNLGMERRITLFCDVPRHDISFFWQRVNKFLLWGVGPHTSFTQAYIQKNVDALEALGFPSRIVPWYSYPLWRHEFLPELLQRALPVAEHEL
jgi:hypothetical protein